MEEEESMEFKWGRKRGIGGRNMGVQFYESFTYDGVDYALLDDVYMHTEDEPEPRVGKLIKIWENPDKSKKVKVQWYFRPRDMPRECLKGIVARDNELFFACGEGIGATDVRPLEAIVGKCNVVCISEYTRNPPSDEALQTAEFVFYRFFDVGQRKVLDKTDGKIAGDEDQMAKEESIEFKWGKKRGIGGKRKNVQFYDSFTYDGVDYVLFDDVYMHTEDEPEPYVGKLIKIWENPDKSKKVKVQWFFRPREMPQKCLKGIEMRDNELFLACGEGIGAANVNPLEAIAGKCNVDCISKDTRNPQPSEAALQRAEFVFHRFFDVGQRKVLENTDGKIAGIEADIPGIHSEPRL